ncbi:hypothetical protein HPB52_004358 [Rhipicephalus sanguineus]|uniref:Uncharacterized protein n=1 Tax=Rhipicephalus sanguineus TaxID=34632 RepID=A0A9D4PCX9_RHISA|nr:hypothetical protein HPB52_004358 [Rhipicephalus sanguineus]
MKAPFVVLFFIGAAHKISCTSRLAQRRTFLVWDISIPLRARFLQNLESWGRSLWCEDCSLCLLPFITTDVSPMAHGLIVLWYTAAVVWNLKATFVLNIAVSMLMFAAGFADYWLASTTSAAHKISCTSRLAQRRTFLVGDISISLRARFLQNLESWGSSLWCEDCSLCLLPFITTDVSPMAHGLIVLWYTEGLVSHLSLIFFVNIAVSLLMFAAGFADYSLASTTTGFADYWLASTTTWIRDVWCEAIFARFFCGPVLRSAPGREPSEYIAEMVHGRGTTGPEGPLLRDGSLGDAGLRLLAAISSALGYETYGVRRYSPASSVDRCYGVHPAGSPPSILRRWSMAGVPLVLRALFFGMAVWATLDCVF